MSSPQPFGSLHGCGPSIILEVLQKAHPHQTISSGAYKRKIRPKLMRSNVNLHFVLFINKLLVPATKRQILKQPSSKRFLKTWMTLTMWEWGLLLHHKMLDHTRLEWEAEVWFEGLFYAQKKFHMVLLEAFSMSCPHFLSTSFMVVFMNST